MKKQTINPVETIYKNLYCLKPSKYSFDIDARGYDLDLSNGSGNYDFKVSTYQSRNENIYFNIAIYDYDKKTEHNAGYFYIKDNNGLIKAEHLQALAEIINEGNKIMEAVFYGS